MNLLPVLGFFLILALGNAGASAADGAARLTTADPSCATGIGRYQNCGNGTVADNRSGLLWLQDAGCVARTALNLTWDVATIEVHNLSDGVCGLSDNSRPGDWRLPTQNEWIQMVAAALALPCATPALTNDDGDKCYSMVPSSFVNVCAFCNYWSATTDGANTLNAFQIDPNTGVATSSFSKNNGANVWPVRYSQ